MDFDLAKRALISHGAREAALSMMYAPEFTTYELADGRIVCITTDRPLKAAGNKAVVKLEVCRNPAKPKGEQVYTESAFVELNPSRSD